MCRVFLLLLVSFVGIAASSPSLNDRNHRYHGRQKSILPLDENNVRNEELDADFWNKQAQQEIFMKQKRPLNLNTAKNVIMFLGDGMSMATVSAARALKGQMEGQTGEESQLSFEKFPSVGLSKTYCVDQQVADSACTSTAYLTGVKANRGTIGVTARVPRYSCTEGANPDYFTESIASWALKSGKEAGIVTTTRITNASPAGAFAHVAQRDWENDSDVVEDGCDPAVNRDIAYQLVHNYPGNQFKVILGGGRRGFLPNHIIDEEGTSGSRLDNVDLIGDWVNHRKNQGDSYAYVWNRTSLLDLDLSQTSHVLGLFEDDHMRYHLEADPVADPTLEELTDTAIRMLTKNDKGYFLFIEGGRIDHGHHDNFAALALDETVEFSKAIERARELTSEEDTLIVVTSDHSHVMTYNGYSRRGSDILGMNDDLGDDGVPYMTLSYANGPGFRPHSSPGVRENVMEHDIRALRYRYPAEVPLEDDTHGGEDVAVFAFGPQQHLFTGLYEQHQIPHLMAYASCLGPGLHAPTCH